MKPVIGVVVAWTVGAATAVAVGLVALSLVGTGLTEGPLQPLAPDGVAQPLGPTPTSTAPAPSSTAPSSTTPTLSDRTISSRGGTVVARCRPGGAYVVAWSPAPGYRTDDVLRGPAHTARVKFESLTNEVTIVVTCVNGSVKSNVVNDDRHR